MTAAEASGSWREELPGGPPDGGDGAALALWLCSAFQEVAGRHAGHLGVPISTLQHDALTWVLLRLDLELEPGVAWRAPVEIETWPSAARGVFAMRDFLATAGDRPLARATTAWCVLDLLKRRPVRLPEAVREIPVPARERVLERRFVRPPAPPRVAHELTVRVAEADLDVNRHVNHLRYLEWALHTLPASFRRRHTLAGLEAEFLAETRAGAQITSQAGAGTEGAPWLFLHRLASASREVARLRSRWVGAAAATPSADPLAPA